MSKKVTPGLVKRGDVWYIQKSLRGYGRVRESTGCSSEEDAEKYLYQRLAEITRQNLDPHPVRTFEEAAIRYLEERSHKTLRKDAVSIRTVAPYLRDLPLDQVHAGTLETFIKDRQKQGVTAGTINRDLAVVKMILSLSARLWRNKDGSPWLIQVPLIPTVTGTQKKPYPLSWDEQRLLFRNLPLYLGQMALFAVNTGCRDQEICGLKWAWEEKLPSLSTSVFVLPAEVVKGRIGKTDDRLVVLNSIAKDVVESRRGIHPEYVFTNTLNRRVTRMNHAYWQRVRREVGLEHVRVHDLRHTFARRLRAAGVSFEDRQDLLGHKAGRVTTHYSRAEIQNLIDAVELLCVSPGKAELTMINIQRARVGS